MYLYVRWVNQPMGSGARDPGIYKKDTVHTIYISRYLDSICVCTYLITNLALYTMHFSGSIDGVLTIVHLCFMPS